MSAKKAMMESNHSKIQSIVFDEKFGIPSNFNIKQIDYISINGFKLDANISEISIDTDTMQVMSADHKFIKTLYITDLKLIGANNVLYLVSRLNNNMPTNIIFIKGIIEYNQDTLDSFKIYYPGQCNICCKIIKDDMDILQEYAIINKLRVDNGQD